MAASALQGGVEWLRQRLYGSRSQIYLHSGPLQKQFAGPGLRLNVNQGWWTPQGPVPPWPVFPISLSHLLFLLFSIQASSGASGLSRSTLLLSSPCPQPAPSHQAGPGPGSSRWLERTSCPIRSLPGLSRNGRASHQPGNGCLATGPPPPSEFLAEMQEQTTPLPKSGGLAEGVLAHPDQNPEGTTPRAGQGPLRKGDQTLRPSP